MPLGQPIAHMPPERRIVASSDNTLAEDSRTR
jgi:hypothetical protein